MKSETLKLVESMNNLNESRYYYGEIEEVKTNLSEIIPKKGCKTKEEAAIIEKIIPA